MDSQEAKKQSLISWLNNLIVLAQWDPRLPLELSGLFTQGTYQQALVEINRESPKADIPPVLHSNGNDWKNFADKVKRVPHLQKLFKNDPFQGATREEVSLLAEVSDITPNITPNAQTILYSRNGTFLTFIEALGAGLEVTIEEEIKNCLDKFQILLAADGELAEMLYKLALSDHWLVILASLRDRNDYSQDENEEVKLTLKAWDQKLRTDSLRSILFKPTRVSQAPKKLIVLAWNNRELFKPAESASSTQAKQPDDVNRKKLTEAFITYVNADPVLKRELDTVTQDLKLLEIVVKHCVDVRKFAKFDGLVYGWPEIAALARARYKNLQDVEEWLVKREPRPSDIELELREAKELFDRAGKDPSFIRFLRMRPYFTEINENEMRRYRSLARVVVSDTAQSGSLPPGSGQPSPARAEPTTTAPRAEVCNLRITKSTSPGTYTIGWLLPEEKDYKEYPLSLNVNEVLASMLASLHTSEPALAAQLRDYFSSPESGKLLYRVGFLLSEALGVDPKLTRDLGAFLKRDGLKRFLITSDDSDALYIPWEWLPRFGSPDGLLIEDQKVSIARASTETQPLAPPLTLPLRLLGILANPPSGYRLDIEGIEKALERISQELGPRVDYKPLVRENASFENLENTLKTFEPHIVHFEGFVRSDFQNGIPELTVFLSSPESDYPGIKLADFAKLMVDNRVQLVVIGRNEVGPIYRNPGPIMGLNLLRNGVQAVLVPTHAIDNASATAFTMDFYREFLIGTALEDALSTARRKRSSAGSDPTAFSLFANPNSLNFFQALPVRA